MWSTWIIIFHKAYQEHCEPEKPQQSQEQSHTLHSPESGLRRSCCCWPWWWCRGWRSGWQCTGSPPPVLRRCPQLPRCRWRYCRWRTSCAVELEKGLDYKLSSILVSLLPFYQNLPVPLSFSFPDVWYFSLSFWFLIGYIFSCSLRIWEN